MIDGYPAPIPQVWDHRIDTLAAILMHATDIGSVHYRHRLMLGMASSHVTAHPRMTTSILSRRYRNTSWCEHIQQRSGNDWEMFRLVWSCAGTVTSSI